MKSTNTKTQGEMKRKISKKVKDLIKFIKFRPYFTQLRRKTVMGWETEIAVHLPDKYLYETPRYKLFWMAFKFAVKTILY